MPAKSVKQRRFMGMMEHNPQMAKARGINMSKQQMHDFAATPEAGLPMRAKSKDPLDKLKRRAKK